MKPVENTLYQVMTATFCVVVLLANIISSKMVPMPFLQDFSVPAGLLFYPLAFVLSDLVTEIYGAKSAKQMVYIALGMNLLCLGLIHFTLLLPSTREEDQMAFRAVLGLSGLRIASSLTAYVISQIVDIQLYVWIKKWTGERFLWLRNNGSVCASQIVDTIVVDMLYLYGGLGMELPLVISIIGFSYMYKVFFSAACTP